MDAVVLMHIHLNKAKRDEKIKRKFLRNNSYILDLPESVFIKSFRLNKEAFMHVLNEIEDGIQMSSIPPMIQLAASLRFLAEGSYQRAVGQDFDIGLARSTVSKVLTPTLNILERNLCAKWINLEFTLEEKQEAKRSFFEKCGIPGVIGCVDGTHVKILKPRREDYLYYNRKGYFSINCLVICDNKMIIKGIDATHPGSCHDSFIWNLSRARTHFLESGERGSWLLGDAGFALEPFLLTPYRNAQPGSMESNFNKKHCSGRNIVERTIGNLKSRFRCLLSSLYYEPKKCVKIINVCCALHNICKKFKIQLDDDLVIQEDEADLETDISDTTNYMDILQGGSEIRDSIAQSLSN